MRSKRSERTCCCDGDTGVSDPPEPPPGMSQPRCGGTTPPNGCFISDFESQSYTIAVESHPRPTEFSNFPPGLFTPIFSWWRLSPTTIDITMGTGVSSQGGEGYLWSGRGTLTFLGETVERDTGNIIKSMEVETEGLFENWYFCPVPGKSGVISGSGLFWGEGEDLDGPDGTRHDFKFGVVGSRLGPFPAGGNIFNPIPKFCGLRGSAMIRNSRIVDDTIDTPWHGNPEDCEPPLVRYPLGGNFNPSGVAPVGYFAYLSYFEHINKHFQNNVFSLQGFKFEVQ